MKKILVLALALVMTSVTGAFALDTGTVNVSASITGTCVFVTDVAALGFGVLDPVAAPAAVANTVPNLQFQCTNNTAYTITDSKGGSGNGALSNGIDTIPYTFAYLAPLAGNATGGVQDLPITANIAALAYQGFSAGSYVDTITVTINP